MRSLPKEELSLPGGAIESQSSCFKKGHKKKSKLSNNYFNKGMCSNGYDNVAVAEYMRVTSHVLPNSNTRLYWLCAQSYPSIYRVKHYRQCHAGTILWRASLWGRIPLRRWYGVISRKEKKRASSHIRDSLQDEFNRAPWLLEALGSRRRAHIGW